MSDASLPQQSTELEPRQQERCGYRWRYAVAGVAIVPLMIWGIDNMLHMPLP